MFTMMNSTGMGYGFIVLWSLHILSVITFFTGVLFLIFFAIKTLTPAQLKSWAIGLMIGGAIVCLFTIAARGGPWIGGKFGRMSGVQSGMMQGNWQSTDDSEQDKEIADGKALYGKLESKHANCQDLSDSDFELVGEYLMAQMAGEQHGQMNTMMKQMMGEEGEEEIHIMMAKRATDCFAR